jgi:hypothetical protein
VLPWRAPVWPLSRAAELLTLPNQISFFREKREERRATGCLSAIRTFVSPTPLALEPNLRTILDPAGLLRGQSLATWLLFVVEGAWRRWRIYIGAAGVCSSKVLRWCLETKTGLPVVVVRGIVIT